MKRLLAATLISFLFLAAASAAPEDQVPVSQGRPPAAPQKQVPVNQGRLEGGTYTNDFFGISFSTPPGWVAQDVAAKQAIMDKGKQIFEGGNNTAREKAGVEASMQRTVFLLSISKYELGATRADFNAQMSFLAERVPTAVVKTGRDYLMQMMRVAKLSSANLELTGPIRAERVGGVSFAVADARLTVGAGVAAQKYYSTISKGHALLFAFTYADEADAQAFEELIKSIRFK
ncbi:MAG: hypothetical protein ACJ74T_11885 [Pyrinomonadaceae bacterium]